MEEEEDVDTCQVCSQKLKSGHSRGMLPIPPFPMNFFKTCASTPFWQKQCYPDIKLCTACY